MGDSCGAECLAPVRLKSGRYSPVEGCLNACIYISIFTMTRGFMLAATTVHTSPTVPHFFSEGMSWQIFFRPALCSSSFQYCVAQAIAQRGGTTILRGMILTRTSYPPCACSCIHYYHALIFRLEILNFIPCGSGIYMTTYNSTGNDRGSHPIIQSRSMLEVRKYSEITRETAARRAYCITGVTIRHDENVSIVI